MALGQRPYNPQSLYLTTAQRIQRTPKPKVPKAQLAHGLQNVLVHRLHQFVISDKACHGDTQDLSDIQAPMLDRKNVKPEPQPTTDWASGLSIDLAKAQTPLTAPLPTVGTEVVGNELQRLCSRFSREALP